MKTQDLSKKEMQETNGGYKPVMSNDPKNGQYGDYSGNMDMEKLSESNQEMPMPGNDAAELNSAI